MSLPLSQIPASEPTLSALVIGATVIGLSALVQLALATRQLFSDNKGERQIEPTALHAISRELKTQTETLAKLDRESGETRSMVARMERDITEIKVTHRADLEGLQTRVGGISRELAATTARVDGLEKREKP